ncbi:hypothetical protein ACROYT_G000790 [Oculina patagonica]
MFKPVTSRLDTQIEATKKLENKGVREVDPLPEYPIEPEDGGDEMPNFEPPPPIDEDEMPNFEPPPPIDEDEMPNFEPPPPIDEDETEDEGEMSDFEPSTTRKRKEWTPSSFKKADQKKLDNERKYLAEERRRVNVLLGKLSKSGENFIKSGPSTVDKIAYVASNFVTPSPSFASMARLLAGQALKGVKDNVDYYKKGKGLDIQKHLSKLGELHMRTPTGKKYNYCGPGTKLEKRLASNDPKYRDPINNLDSICQQHDIDYSNSKSLADKHKADDLMLKRISKIPFKDRPWGTTGVQALIASKRKIGLGIKKKKAKKRKKPSGEENWQEKLADELHTQIKRNFTRRRVIVNHIDEIWCSDLVEMQQFSKWNKGYRYLLMVLDVFSKYGWIVSLKDKKGETVTQAFKTIFKEGRKPQYLWTDKGKEYYNKNMKELLEKNSITLYSTENEEKSSVCERWNRTIKTRMWKQFTAQGNTTYLDMLPKLLKQYNNTKHSSIKMTPVEASRKKNEGLVYFNLYGDMETSKPKPKFKIGDKVRISKYKRNIFDKGYTPNWTEEIFTIDKIQYTNPITFKLKDLNNEDIQGSFYEPEMLKAKQEVFRIDKVIRRDYKKKQALVKWKGYSDDFNSWIPIKDLKDI